MLHKYHYDAQYTMYDVAYVNDDKLQCVNLPRA